ncbi:MAG TPA: DUF2203 family protein [Gemmatales bacterium]|nr:DUF2203 family protein [Gemmatales bacterium]HMP61486.1 DUF2203 family protein [Gemmatales bacterium]
MKTPKGKNPTRSGQRRSDRRSMLSLGQAEQRLPLVRQVAAAVQGRWARLARLEVEQSDLERRRLKLNWPERARRYEIGDDIARERQLLQEEVFELEQIQAILVDPVQGEVAFPTLIQGRSAYFVWNLGDEQVQWWCFANEPNRRPIPPSWRKRAEPKGPKTMTESEAQTEESPEATE